MFIGFLTAFWYFYLDDYILYIFPNLARKATLAELIQNQEKYDETWVRVRVVAYGMMSLLFIGGGIAFFVVRARAL